MWRNTDVVKFVAWLREHNASLPTRRSQAGFYGLDLYSLHASIEAVVDYLDASIRKQQPARGSATRASTALGARTPGYGWEVSIGTRPSCEDESVRSLLELQHRASDYARRDGRVAEDDFFYAEQNARLIKNAERYYRSMFGRPVRSGISATGTWPKPSTSSSSISTSPAVPRAWLSGSTIRMSAMRAPPRWVREAN